MAFAAFGGGNAAATSDSAKKSGKAIVFALLAPGLIYLGLFFFTPLVSLIATSLEAPDPSGAIGAYQYAFNIDNYGYVVGTYLPQIGRSFYYATVATILALLISFPLAYFIGVKLRSNPLVQRLLVTLVIAPFFISFLLRTIAWKQIFSDSSWIMTTLHSSGLLAPDQFFLGTDAAVIFGLTYNFIPFMTLPLYTTLERFDVRLLEAGSDLYASPAKVFRRITLPISMPGIISGTLLTFIPITGDYVNASRDFLGSSKTSMIGTMVEADFLQNWDYPSASALSVLLMAVIVTLVSIYVRRAGTEDLL
jgi:spermidine/putrescine transport system permease protein